MKKNYELLGEIINRLPDFCFNFLYNGQSENNSKTALSYARDIEYFLNFAINYYPYFCDKALKDITITDLAQIKTNDINLYLTIMKEEFELSTSTRARRKSSISGLFKYLVDTEHKLDYNPISGASKVKQKKKSYIIYLTIEEQEKLLQCIDYGTGLTKKQLEYHNAEKIRDKAIIFLFLDTGLRISELQSLNINDIDFSAHCVYLIRKRDKAERVYFSDEAEKYINDYLGERKKYIGDDPLFISTKTGERLGIRSIQAMLEKYTKASLPNKKDHISPHKLRSSFAMEFYKRNRDIMLLKDKMGHDSIEATNFYVEIADKELLANTRNWRKDS